MKKSLMIAIMSVAFFGMVSCSISEPKSKNENKQDKPTLTTSTTVAGIKISASSISELQTAIDGCNDGAVLDLSNCNISGELTVSKSLTLRNYTNESADIVITDPNVTLTGFNVNSVTTRQQGSTGLKIANSNLASLTLSGDGIARGGSRADNKPDIRLISCIVRDNIGFDEAVELNVANFGLNVANFTGDASATVNLTEQSYNEIKDKTDGKQQDFNKNLSYEEVYSDIDEFGTPTTDFMHFSAQKFPENAIVYINHITEEFLDDKTFKIPEPSLSDSTGDYGYDWGTFNYAISLVAAKCAVLNVNIPESGNFNKSDYIQSLKNAGFDYNEYDALVYSNLEEFNNKLDSFDENIDESNPIQALNDYKKMLEELSDSVVYNIEVSIDDSYDDPITVITYIGYLSKFGDMSGLSLGGDFYY